MATRTKRPMSEHARAAKAIRTKIRATWPGTTFRVTSDSFAGGNAVDVTWTDGPTISQVERLIHWHEAGTFDGMTDSYDYDRIHPNIPQAKYVQTHRAISDRARSEAEAYIAATYEPMDPITTRDYIHRTTYRQSLVCDDCQHVAHVGDNFCEECGSEIHRDV